MFRSLLIAICVCFSICASAQTADSLFVKQADNGWVIKHKVKSGETVFSLARRYHVPPAILADANGINYQQELMPSMKLYIPVGAYNLLNGKPVNPGDARAFYVRAGEGESLYRIARNSNVQQKTIQQWNQMDNTEIDPGQVLLAGWVLYDATPVMPVRPDPLAVVNNAPPTPPQQPQPPKTNIQVQQPVKYTQTEPVKTQTSPVRTFPVRPVSKDTLYIVDGDTISTNHEPPAAPVSEMEALYQSQTDSGANLVEEKGPAVFYPSHGKSGVYFAFHNTAPKGSIIKVFNPGSGKTIFVKVLGPIPGTALYHNSVIGIPDKAKAELGVMEDKAWCELTYAGF